MSRVTWRDQFEDLKDRRPGLADRVCRKLITEMQARGLIELETLDEAVASELKTPGTRLRFDPNRPAAKLPPGARRALFDVALTQAEHNLDPEEISATILLVEKRQLAYEVSRLAEDPESPLAAVREKLHEFLDFAPGEAIVPREDVIGTRAALIRRVLTDHVEFIAVAKEFIRVREMADVFDHMIPTDGNQGRLGGKAAGLILARSIMRRALADGELDEDVQTPLSYYLPSNGILEFIEHNGLEELINVKYRSREEVDRDYPIIQRLFKSGEFPKTLHEGLRRMLEQIGEGPLVVRSSSLLEDRIGHAFSGKYKSLFIANVGTVEERLQELENAIAEVYASIFGADPIEYRRERRLLDFQEQMGVIIQRVVGRRMGDLHMPVFAGVAFSRCDMRWSPRIRRTDGMARLVVGLGTRAVDRTVDDYPMLVALEQPLLRAAQQPDELNRYSQQAVDVIDLRSRQFETVPLKDLVERAGTELPKRTHLFSIFRDRQLLPMVGTASMVDPGELVVTFDRLVRSPFPRRMKRILDVLERGLDEPVDVEFADDGEELNVLQCRALSIVSAERREPIPTNLLPDDIVFSADRYVNTGQVRGIEYVVLIDPIDYEKLTTEKAMRRVASAVGVLNRALPARRFILMGPGRWGSRGDIRLGVPVTYSDICHAAVLIEVARRKGAYVPDVSFGTHFFQDLVEAKIAYLPLYPEEPGVVWNERLLNDAPSVLADLAPQYEDLADVVRVVHVPEVADGRHLDLVMDGEDDTAVAYLAWPHNP